MLEIKEGKLTCIVSNKPIKVIKKRDLPQKDKTLRESLIDIRRRALALSRDIEKILEIENISCKNQSSTVNS